MRARAAVAALVAMALALVLAPGSSAGSLSTPSRVAVRHLALPSTEGGATEGAVAVDPRDARRMAVLAVDYSGYLLTVPGAGLQSRLAPTCRLFTTLDGGRTWSTQDFPGAHLPDAPYLSASNPSLSLGPDGVLHAVCLPNSSQGGSAVVYASGRLGEPLVAAGLPVSPPQAGPVAWPDKPWVTTAPNGRDVTVAWGEFVTSPGYLPQVLARTSHDGGATFGQPQVVSADTLTTQTANNVATPLYLRDGGLVVAWHGSVSAPGSAPADDVVVADPDVAGSTVVAVRGIAASGVEGSYPRHANQPSLAQDPRTGRLYLAVGLQTGAGVRAALATSVDGGRHWSAPTLVRPEPSGHDQLNAAVAVNDGGVVGVVYQDVLAGRMTTEMDVRGAHGTLRHLVLSSAPLKVRPYAPPTSNGTPIGDFLSVRAAGGSFTTAWPEQRGPQLQLEMAVVTAG